MLAVFPLSNHKTGVQSAVIMESSTQLRDWRNPTVMEEETVTGYSERLFYHVYSHALSTRADARELGKWCVYNGLEVDFYVLDWAALGHDYGYLDYKYLPLSIKELYPSREKYAAAMIGGKMANLGAPAETIEAVKQAIWSTEVEVKCISLEGKIIRQADLNNVGNESHPAFFWNTLKLYREHRLMGDENPNLFYPREFINYCIKSSKILSIYNEEDVSLGDFDRKADGRSIFCELAAANIRMLLPDRIQDLAQMAGSQLLKSTKEAGLET